MKDMVADDVLQELEGTDVDGWVNGRGRAFKCCSRLGDLCWCRKQGFSTMYGARRSVLAQESKRLR
jgi:hypothetical protein